jgi:hypothetical protein
MRDDIKAIKKMHEEEMQAYEERLANMKRRTAAIEQQWRIVKASIVLGILSAVILGLKWIGVPHIPGAVLIVLLIVWAGLLASASLNQREIDRRA